jgi:tRNA A37 N6-isopentenylltransferase MiaA
MKKNIFIVYGPTGSGKTSLSYNIIQHFFSCNKLNKENLLFLIKNIYKNEKCTIDGHGEYPIQGTAAIINMDSKQIYYSLKSLTASPLDQQQSTTFHYLFNTFHPWENLTVDFWYNRVLDFIDNTSYDYYIVIGGSSFYLKYLLTDRGFNGSNDFHFLIETFLTYYRWPWVVSAFDQGSRFIPHGNDEFRKYNFLKNYFNSKFGLHLLPHYLTNTSTTENQPTTYGFIIVVLNPSNEILLKNIINRASDLSLVDLKTEALEIQSNHQVHKNFHTIIGYSNLINQWNMDEFIVKTFQYAKSQKKWINYFIKNNFFGKPYFLINIQLNPENSL